MPSSSNSGSWVLIGFGLAAVLAVGVVTVVQSTGDPPVEQSGSAAETASLCGDLFEELFPETGVELEPDEPGEGEFDPFAEALFAECAGPSGVVVVVQGLPEVSGVYSTTDGDLAVSGFGGLEFGVGRCFVGNPGESFQTKVTHSDEEGGFLITVDVGVAGDGMPVAAVQRANVALEAVDGGDSGLLSSEISHDYEFAHYRQRDAPISLTTKRRDETWAGQAVLTSTFYNIRDFIPYTGISWEGSPSYPGRISVFCTAGTPAADS